MVFDIDLKPDFSFEELLLGYQIEEKQIYCKGICKNCVKSTNFNGETPINGKAVHPCGMKIPRITRIFTNNFFVFFVFFVAN